VKSARDLHVSEVMEVKWSEVVMESFQVYAVNQYIDGFDT
jgi:hypothetical protein